MSWMYYLLEANLYLIIFYALYCVVLRRETWHQYNRAYLLGSSALAFIIPVIQLGFLKPVPAAELPPQLLTSYSYVAAVKAAPVSQPAWNRDDIFLAAYLAIVCCLLIGLAVKITKLLLLSRRGPARDFGKWKMVKTDMERGAFSFFNYLFLSTDMAVSDTVITHELVHIRQKHSWDIIYLELYRIFNWFNPVAYLLQHSIKELHEFIADEAITGSKEQIDTYTDFLVANAYGTYEHQLTNNLFNQSLLKKRIMMLHEKRSGNTARLKYLLALPLLGGLLCASTLAFAKDYGWVDIAPRKALPAGINTNNNLPSIKDSKNKPATGIPLLGPGSIGFIIDPGTYSSKTLIWMSLKFQKKGYTMDFNDYKDYENNPILKISLRKNSAALNSGTSVIFNVNKLKKAGDAIFVGADPAKNSIHVESHKFVFLKNDATQKQPSPPAKAITDNGTSGVIQTKTGKAKTLLYQSSQVAAKTTTPLIMINGRPYNLTERLKPGQYLYATASDSIIQYSPGEISAMRKWGRDARTGVIELFGKSSVQVLDGANDTGKITGNIHKGTDSTIRGKINSTINKQLDSVIRKNNEKIKGEIKGQINQQIQKTTNKLPPPSVTREGFGAFSNHLETYTRFPAKELNQRIPGNVVIEITLNNDHKISGVKVTNDARPDFGNEVVRAAKLYMDAIDSAPGTYIMLVQFNIMGEKMTKSFLPESIYPTLENKSNFAGNVELSGFFKD